jgi:hypothetical protein
MTSMSLLRRSSKPCVIVPIFTLIAALFVVSPALAKTVVRGKVKGGRHYVIIGLSPSGNGVTQTLGANGRFKVTFRGKAGRGASLQLIRPNSRYFGPVVFARQHKKRKHAKAYTNLSGKSVSLGKIRLKRGYAQVSGKVNKKAVDRKLVTRTNKKGAPVGAGRLGLVRTKKRKSAAMLSRSSAVTSQADSPSTGADTDRDGIPNAYDVDSNGNLVLNNIDPSTSNQSDGIFSTLFANLDQSLNVHVGNVTTADIDALINTNLALMFFFDQAPDAPAVTSADVQCFTLSYCAPGASTGIITGVNPGGPDNLPQGQPWASYDLNNDGLPDLQKNITNGGGVLFSAQILPRATTAQIAPGDAYDVLFNTAAGTTTVPRSLPAYFVTTPATISYDVGNGPQTIAYPVASDAPGTDANPITMASDSITFTFFRPQRQAIAGAETGDYVDMGHLHYGSTGSVGNHESVGCGGDYSNLSPTLSVSPMSADTTMQLFPLLDSASDSAPSEAGTLSFTFNLGDCLRRNGVDPAGQRADFTLTAVGESRRGGVDRAGQNFAVKFPG